MSLDGKYLVLDPEVDFLEVVVLQQLDRHGILLVVIEGLLLQRRDVDFYCGYRNRDKRIRQIHKRLNE